MDHLSLAAELAVNSYPGRGIVIGRSDDGLRAVLAYFIMGRSANSRNRVFVQEPDGIRTEAFDPAKLADPSLIIYHPVRQLGRALIVTNGDQTDTIRDHLELGESFEQGLRTRAFEPDGPNWTPRISGLLSAFRTAEGELRQSAAASLYRYLCQQAPIAPICFKNGSVLTQYGRLDQLNPTQYNVFYDLSHWTVP